ncbi:hypothetical protein Hanom_Chr10g00900681 [Helianthus anomalus]
MGASPFELSLFGPNGSPFGSRLFGPNGSPFMDTHLPITHEHRQSMPKRRELNQTQYGNQHSLMHDTHPHPQAHSFTFQNSTVTYGVLVEHIILHILLEGLTVTVFEEHKEADSTTGPTAHRISRGINDKVFNCYLLMI